MIYARNHGTSVINATSIMNNGFNLDKCGCNWGNTYGKGIYYIFQITKQQDFMQEMKE